MGLVPEAAAVEPSSAEGPDLGCTQRQDNPRARSARVSWSAKAPSSGLLQPMATRRLFPTVAAVIASAMVAISTRWRAILAMVSIVARVSILSGAPELAIGVGLPRIGGGVFTVAMPRRAGHRPTVASSGAKQLSPGDVRCLVLQANRSPRWPGRQSAPAFGSMVGSG